MDLLMGLFVVLLFTLPIVIVLAVVAVKLLEVALDRNIASSKAIALKTTVVVFGTAAFGVAAWFLYVVVGMSLSGDPS